MCPVERGGDLRRVVEGLAQRQRLSCQTRGQRFSLEQFHYQIAHGERVTAIIAGLAGGDRCFTNVVDAQI